MRDQDSESDGLWTAPFSELGIQTIRKPLFWLVQVPTFSTGTGTVMTVPSDDTKFVIFCLVEQKVSFSLCMEHYLFILSCHKIFFYYFLFVWLISFNLLGPSYLDFWKGDNAASSDNTPDEFSLGGRYSYQQGNTVQFLWGRCVPEEIVPVQIFPGEKLLNCTVFVLLGDSGS